MESAALLAVSRSLIKPNCNPNQNSSSQTLPSRSLSLAPQRKRFNSLSARCLHASSATSDPNPNFCCSAVASDMAAPASHKSSTPQLRLRRLVEEFASLPEPLDRVKLLLEYATSLPFFPASARVLSNRVMGCTAQVLN
jgi:quinolinate synthase